MATLGVGKAEEQDYNQVLLFPELSVSLQITPSPLLGMPGSLPLKLGYKEIKPLRAICTFVALNTSLLFRDVHLQSSPCLRDAGNLIEGFFLFSEVGGNAYPLFLLESAVFHRTPFSPGLIFESQACF